MLKLKDVIDFSAIKVLEPTDEEVLNIPPNSFQLINRYGAVLYTILFQDLDVKKQWILDFNSIKEVIEENHRNHHFFFFFKFV